MKLQDVFDVIQPEIDSVEGELKRLAGELPFQRLRGIVERFFSSSGKYLRPALVLLSARAFEGSTRAEAKKRLVDTAAGVELIHNASLVHDDILDDEAERRGQPTLNEAWGNRIALLAGDALYSKAFSVLIGSLSADLLRQVVDVNIRMCTAEVEQERAREGTLGREQFLGINEGKTASFMGLCCKLGASLAGAGPEATRVLETFGLRFGMAYQLFDDHADGDALCSEIDAYAEGLAYARSAISALEGLPPSVGRGKLLDLTEYLIAISTNS